MMASDIERAAIAAAADYGFEWTELPKDPIDKAVSPAAIRADMPCRSDFTDMARAAFSVLRDPSPELVEATARGIDPVAWRVPEPDPIGQPIRRDVARIQARAALTAAVVFLVGDGDA